MLRGSPQTLLHGVEQADDAGVLGQKLGMAVIVWEESDDGVMWFGPLVVGEKCTCVA